MIELVSVLVMGIGAYWLSWRLRIPSILLLLLFGFLAGPVTGFLHPDEMLGDLLFPWVSLSVAIILFEGGLSLRVHELQKIGTVVRNLITVGVGVTWILSACAAHYFLGMRWPLSLLLGAILVVTGPTVIVPMLKSLRLSERIGPVLKWEAMLNDPVGAILAVLVFEATFAAGVQEATSHALLGILKAAAIGVGLGVLATWIMKVLLKKYWIPDFLQSTVILMIVLATFALSNQLQAESGLLAVTIAGLLLANQRDIEVRHIAEFKENLRILLISSLFIILAARLQIRYITEIGLPHLLFLASLFFVIRPLAVFLSTIRSNLTTKEKLFLSWMAPRGIVAAAVASVFTLYLEKAGHPKADELLAATFLVIIVTVLTYGLSGPWLAKAFGLAQPNPQGVLIAGAHAWARKLGSILKAEGIHVLVVDSNWSNVHAARLAGLTAIRRDILSENLIDDLELGGIGRFLALTPNDEVNSLAAIRFSEVFGRAEVYRLAISEGERRESKDTSRKVYGRVLFGEGKNYAYLHDLFARRAKIRKIALTEQYNYEAFKKELQDRALPLFLITESKQLRVFSGESTFTPRVGQSLIVLSSPEPAETKSP